MSHGADSYRDVMPLAPNSATFLCLETLKSFFLSNSFIFLVLLLLQIRICEDEGKSRDGWNKNKDLRQTEKIKRRRGKRSPEERISDWWMIMRDRRDKETIPGKLTQKQTKTRHWDEVIRVASRIREEANRQRWAYRKECPSPDPIILCWAYPFLCWVLWKLFNQLHLKWHGNLVSHQEQVPKKNWLVVISFSFLQNIVLEFGFGFLSYGLTLNT